jgi:phage gp37-like protein
MASTILYGWVYNATGGSVLLTLIMHATEPLLWISFTGADETRATVIRVLIYVATAVIVVLLAGKNLGRKETLATQTDLQPAATAV